jgi:hypothetical protein
LDRTDTSLFEENERRRQLRHALARKVLGVTQRLPSPRFRLFPWVGRAGRPLHTFCAAFYDASMKTIRCLLLTITLALVSGRGEEWRKVAFIGDADVKSIAGVVEVVSGGEERILHPKEVAVVGQTLRVWRGAEVVLMMKNSKSLVRAKGPVLLRLASEQEGYGHASVTGEEAKSGFVVRAVRGHGKYQDGPYWREIHTGMCLPEGTRVRPFHDSVLDFYHPATRSAVRVTDPWHQTALVVKQPAEPESAPTILASQNP